MKEDGASPDEGKVGGKVGGAPTDLVKEGGATTDGVKECGATTDGVKECGATTEGGRTGGDTVSTVSHRFTHRKISKCS